MDIFAWIDGTLEPTQCNSEEFIYNDMESQSGRVLPIIYQPFDITARAHWRDRGALFDFLAATEGRGKKILDFGPGDGWPSLIVAPFVREVIGVEGSRKRCEVCRENAKRLGIENAVFEYVPPGGALPFEGDTFDAAVAASSVEQTPDPGYVLGEIHRVLKGDGRFRIYYEDLDRYRGGRERETDIEDMGGGRSSVIIYDRHIDEEYASMYRIALSVPYDRALALLSVTSGSLSLNKVSVPQLEAARPFIVEAKVCRLVHPSGRTLARWLEEVGFRHVRGTHDAIRFAGRLFDRLPEDRRPVDLANLDGILRPLAEIVVGMEAPLSLDPMITAVK